MIDWRAPLLLITTKRLLVEEVITVVRPLRLPVEVSGTPPAAQDWYLTAPLVMIGADMLASTADNSPSRRPHLVVISAEPDRKLPTVAAKVLPGAVVGWLPQDAAWLTAQITTTLGSIADTPTAV